MPTPIPSGVVRPTLTLQVSLDPPLRRRSADDALASARHVDEVYYEVRPGLEQAEEMLLSV